MADAGQDGQDDPGHDMGYLPDWQDGAIYSTGLRF